MWNALVCGLVWGGALATSAASVSDYAVRLSAISQSSPPQIILTWPADAAATNCLLYRKLRDDSAWGSAVSLAALATNYVDSNVEAGGAYEYQIARTTPSYDSYGYIYAGIEVPLVESRGTVILLVDNSCVSSLTAELTRLQQDLVGEGWTVLRHDVPRMKVDPADTNAVVGAARASELASAKSLVLADYNANPSQVRVVFLLGHVLVPYSGVLAPDGHSQHSGAWPADVYYGNLDGIWGDSKFTSTGVSDLRNRNVPGDGKFDPSRLPSDVALQVGRVDLANLPAFSLKEIELLRQYLNKDHNFRHALLAVERRGLIDDNFGLSTGEPLAVNGWGNFAPMFGAGQTFTSASWIGTLATQSYLWGYGCGSGTFTACGGVASSTDFAANDPRVVFTMFFGSYFGDWDAQNNFLRAAVATPNYTLTSVWAGRPNWQFHHMALGETVGFSTRLSQNNSATYRANSYARYVHVALMGDPTLRLHPVAPPTSLVAAAHSTGGVDLSWRPSPDAIMGYHVYRAATVAGPFTRLNGALLGTTNYTDPASGSCSYMVRAVKLEVSGSGSYWNASQGIYCGFEARPILTITASSTSKVYGAPVPTLTAAYSGFVNGDTTNSLSSLAVLSTPATAGSPVGRYPITPSGASSSNYTLVYSPGTLVVQPAVPIGLGTSTANPALPGQLFSLSMTLQVVDPGAGTPSGAVQFKIAGANAGGPVVLSGSTATYFCSALAHGAYPVSAEYAGDGNFAGTTNWLWPDLLMNTPPVAGTDQVGRWPGREVKVLISSLLGNDFDADNDPVSFDGVGALSSNGGQVSIIGDWVVYTPPPGFTNTDTFTYTIRDSYAAQAHGMVVVHILSEEDLSSGLTITVLSGGSYLIRGDGIPGRAYRVVFAEELEPPSWQTLGTATADALGAFVLMDENGSAQRFYRLAYP